MKALIVGDVHGTTLWKRFIGKEEEYKYIACVGDYFDDWKNDWTKVDQIENVKEMIEWKHKYPEKITLLIGNHDLAYVMGEIVSGHQAGKSIDIKEFMEKNIDEFDVAYRVGEWVCSHAGFSGYWMKKFGFVDIKDVNEAFHNKNYEPFRFYSGDYSFTGESYLQSPLWIRPESLKCSAYYDKQIVGHTATDRMKTNHLKFKSIFEGKDKQEIYIVDKHDHSAYLELKV